MKVLFPHGQGCATRNHAQKWEESCNTLVTPVSSYFHYFGFHFSRDSDVPLTSLTWKFLAVLHTDSWTVKLIPPHGSNLRECADTKCTTLGVPRSPLEKMPYFFSIWQSHSWNRNNCDSKWTNNSHYYRKQEHMRSLMSPHNHHDILNITIYAGEVSN